jgi:glucoamylase
VADDSGRGGRAFGAPGIDPRWTRGAKDAVGTAYSASSDVWFTIARGVLTEIYYPTIDTPQVRDVEFMISDGETFVHEEKRHLQHKIEKIDSRALGYIVTNRDPEGRYELVKEIISDPHEPVVLQRVKIECSDPVLLKKLRVYVLIAPHLDGDGADDSGYVRSFAGRPVLAAHGTSTYLVVASNAHLVKRSVGYVGFSDGWQDLMTHKEMRWEFTEAPSGNIAMCAEIDISERQEFTLGLAFGDSEHRAASTLLQSLGNRYKTDQRPRFIRQWERAGTHIQPLFDVAGDGGVLFHSSHQLLLAHEDKCYPGALIASLSIPWGDAKGDEDIGGYHLVWTRDMCNSSGGLLACGDTTTPLRSLIYLACTQRPDGGFYQNFWIDGRPYWHGIQLDEVSSPIVLAWRLAKLDALGNFDPYQMVLGAAKYVINQGPYTPQERWEENSGYSPSTLASNIAGLVCAAEMANARGDRDTAQFILDYADFLESHVEAWTVTTQGALLSGVPRHYIRIHPVDVTDYAADEDPDHGQVLIKNRPPGEQATFPAKDIVDPGFLELVRYGIRKAGSPLMEDSLRVVDAELKVDTPAGPVWHRYNHDGYGESSDGEPFKGWGIGRGWPLLTGERAHYELAAGRDVTSYIRTMERFANEVGLLPEQVWDRPDWPERHMVLGKPTGAAMPLMWAHAEYLKLLRSRRDGAIFDVVGPVADRYLGGKGRQDLEVWKFNRRVRRVAAGSTLRLQAESPFVLRVTQDGWQTNADVFSTATKLGIHFVNVTIARDAKAPVQFTFHWPDEGRWEGTDFKVEIDPPRATSTSPARAISQVGRAANFGVAGGE